MEDIQAMQQQLAERIAALDKQRKDQAEQFAKEVSDRNALAEFERAESLKKYQAIEAERKAKKEAEAEAEGEAAGQEDGRPVRQGGPDRCFPGRLGRPDLPVPQAVGVERGPGDAAGGGGSGADRVRRRLGSGQRIESGCRLAGGGRRHGEQLLLLRRLGFRL